MESLDAAAPARRPADAAMRRFLRLPEGRAPRSRTEVHKAFSTSILVSATRCLLTYVVLPFVAPALGWAAGVGPWIGMPLSVVGIGANVLSIRRFWAADHRWRWAFTAIGTGVIVLLSILLAGDLARLVG